MALAAALFCGAGGEPASAAGMAIAYPAAPAPIVTVRGNAVVNSANKPNGTYELALCVQTRVYTYVGTDATKAATLTPEEYQAEIDAGTITAGDYQESNNPFESVSASVVVDLDALTPIQWDVDAPTYAAWDGTSYADYDEGYTPAGAAATGYARGIDTTDLLGTVIPDVTGATLGRPGRVVALDTAKPDEVGTAEALVEGYIHADGKTYAVVSLSANVPHSAKGRTYDTATEVVVVRFAYDMKRFPNTKFTATTPSEFNVTLDENTTGTGPRTVTYLASDADAAQTVTGQGVWYQSNTDRTGATQQETMHYFYRAGNGPIPGTVLNEKVTVSIDGDTQDSRELPKPDTAGKTVLTHDTAATEPYSLTRNLLKTHDRSLRFTYVNQPTYREAKGTGGAMVLFYDWDDTLIGTLVVDPEGDVRAQVNEYVEQNLVHPDLRAGTVLAAMGGEAPDYASLTAPTADQTKYQNLCDSLERQYTYRGKYPYTVGGSTVQDDPNALSGEEYPLTNKLDYAFYRRVTTPTEATDPATSATSTYFTTQKVSETGENDENLYPYVYGWAVVEDLSAKNARDWQVRRDAAKVPSIWTTVGVGELADVDPQAAARDIPGAAADPGTGLTPQYTFSTSAAAGNDYLHFADFSDMGSMLTKTVTVAGEDVTFTKDTLIVKAVYEPGPDLAVGMNYQMIEEPAYNKLNDKTAEGGGAYSVNFTLERASTELGPLQGVSRVRDPYIRLDTTTDLKWEDQALENASEYEAYTSKAKTSYIKVLVDNGNEVDVELTLSARMNKIDYVINDAYGKNFVSGDKRSIQNWTNHGDEAAFIVDNYNYSTADSDLTDPYFDVINFADKEGSRGFVLYGTLNNVMQKATQYNHGEIIQSEFNSYVAYGIMRDANLRADNLGTQPSAGSTQTAMRQAILDAAKACEDNHYGEADYWDSELDCAQLNYHQLQWYILDGTLLSRADADAKALSWCHLHAACAASVSNAPTDWASLIDAAQNHPDYIDELNAGQLEGLSTLRMDAAGTLYSTLGTGAVSRFKTDLVAAVTAGCTSWDAIQYHIIHKAPPTDDTEALSTYWWYDGATSNPAPANFAALYEAAKHAITDQPYPDGTMHKSTAKFNAAQGAFDKNAAAVEGKTDAAWVRMTHNLVKAHAETTINAGMENEEVQYTTTKFTSFAEFRTAYLSAVQDPTVTDPATEWSAVQLAILKQFNAADTGGDPSFWWKDGKTPLKVMNIRTLLQAAALANSADPDEQTMGNEALGKLTLADLAGDPYYLAASKKGAPLSGQYTAVTDLITDIKAAQQAGATDWNSLQYYLIYKKVETDPNAMSREAAYYWWRGGGTGTNVDFSSTNLNTIIQAFMEAALRGNEFGDPKAIASAEATKDVNGKYTILRLTPTDPATQNPEVTQFDSMEWYTDINTLLAKLTEIKTFMNGKQGITDPYQIPVVDWYQAQWYILNNTYLDLTNATDVATAIDAYWWYDLPEKPVQTEEEPTAGLVEILQGIKDKRLNLTTDYVNVVTAEDLANWGLVYLTADKTVTIAEQFDDFIIGYEQLQYLYYDFNDNGFFDGGVDLTWAQIQYYFASAWADTDGYGTPASHEEALQGLRALGWTDADFPDGAKKD